MTLIEPNIHPILVHFTYALMTTGALCMLVVSLAPERAWRDSLGHAADWMIAFGAIAIVLTVAAGFEAYYSVAHDGPSHEAMTTHRNWAVPTALALLGLTAWRWKQCHERPGTVFAGLLLVAALALSVTAWWGGRLVYHHGLGVAGLPQVTGEGHDHHHGSEAASNPHDAAMSGGAGNHHGQMDESTMDAMPQGHDDASETHDHSGHAH